MYDYLPIIFGIGIIICGIFMTVSPKASTKKELRDNEDAVKKVAKNGKIMIGCGVLLIVLGIVRFTILS